MRRIWILSLLLALLITSGCVEEGPDEITPEPVPEPVPTPVPSEEPEVVTPPVEAKWYSVYFTYEDNVEANLVDYIDSAQDTIPCRDL